MRYLFSVALFVTSLMVQAAEFEVSFGLVLTNSSGEPIGFKETRQIPLSIEQTPALYGVVVTKQDDDPFVLGAIHVLPSAPESEANKIMGKPMMVVKRGAMLMRTENTDEPGDYKVEIYLDNRLHQTIDYSVVPPGI